MEAEVFWRGCDGAELVFTLEGVCDLLEVNASLELVSVCMCARVFVNVGVAVLSRTQINARGADRAAHSTQEPSWDSSPDY